MPVPMGADKITDPIAAVSRAKYVLLTTFKRDGSAVATPVWAVAEDGGLLVWTPRGSGKVKRIRNSGRVTVAPCTMRGRPTGVTVDATAMLLDAGGTLRAQDAIGRKYGWLGRTWLKSAVRRAGQDAVIGIRIAMSGVAAEIG
jgi:PPOX class probable F420-dependent enzyme